MCRPVTITKNRDRCKVCPFCGDASCLSFVVTDGLKWGAVQCGCGAVGPDVRTSYQWSSDEPWHEDAIAEWNKRIQPGAVTADSTPGQPVTPGRCEECAGSGYEPLCPITDAPCEECAGTGTNELALELANPTTKPEVPE